MAVQINVSATIIQASDVKVVQTSANQKVVRLLQAHAAEVSDMSLRGMVAVHERMAGTDR